MFVDSESYLKVAVVCRNHRPTDQVQPGGVGYFDTVGDSFHWRWCNRDYVPTFRGIPVAR